MVPLSESVITLVPNPESAMLEVSVSLAAEQKGQHSGLRIA